MNDLPAKLRQLRQEKKVSQIAVARALNVSKSLYSGFEQGRCIPQPDTAEQLDKYFGSGDTIQKMSAEALDARGQERERQQRKLPVFQSWSDLEESATMLRNFQPLLIPGLLQTEGYVRASFEGARTFSPEEVELHVADRMARQGIFSRENPPHFISVMDEAVLRRAVGGQKVMREQFQALLDACERPRCAVQVVPEDAGAYPGTSGPFVLATVDQGTYGFVEDPLGGRVIDDGGEIITLAETWEAVRSYALNQRQSLDLIARMAETWS